MIKEDFQKSYVFKNRNNDQAKFHLVLFNPLLVSTNVFTQECAVFLIKNPESMSFKECWTTLPGCIQEDVRLCEKCSGRRVILGQCQVWNIWSLESEWDTLLGYDVIVINLCKDNLEVLKCRIDILSTSGRKYYNLIVMECERPPCYLARKWL